MNNTIDVSQPPPNFIRGCEPRSDRFGSTFFPLGRDIVKAYPRVDWPRLVDSNRSIGVLARKVYNQRQEGSCATQATVQAWAISMAMVNIEWVIPLSAMPLYKSLASGPNQGTTINENLDFMRKVGTLPLDTAKNREWMQERGLNPEHVMPETGWSTPLPRGWEDTAKHFRIREASDCENFAACVAAILDNKPTVYGRDGHAICGVNVSRIRGYSIDYINSYNRWGDPIGPPPAIQYGLGHDTEDNIERQISRYGAWSIDEPYISEIFTEG